MKSILILAVGLCLAVCADEPPTSVIERVAGGAKAPPALTASASARDVLQTCRAMLPSRPIELNGSLILRSRKGIVSSEHDYRLVLRRSAEMALMTIRLFPRGATNEVASVTISRRPGMRPLMQLAEAGKVASIDSPLACVLKTDVTWLDLTFDFLWWSNAVYETAREGESVHGQKCLVILVKPDVKIEGLSAVRLWVDKRTGCLMQSEQIDEKGVPMRRLWGTRVKKMDGKWMVSVLEVETPGARHRTKITVDGLREL